MSNALKKIINSNIQNHNIYKSKYDTMKINSIIFNKKTHYLSLFKDYILWNDITEFLQIYYHYNIIKIYFKKYFKPKEIFYTICYIHKKVNNIMLLNKKANQNFIKLKKDEKENQLKKEFSNILNNISANDTHFSIINNSQITESTIDNIGVNDDITQSIDLRINQNYDFNEIEKEIDFVKGFNANDKTIENLMYLIKDKNYLKNKKEEAKIINKKKGNNLNEINPYLKININQKINEENNFIKKHIKIRTGIGRDIKISGNNSKEKNELNTWTLKRKKTNIEVKKEFNKTLKKPNLSINVSSQNTKCDIQISQNYLNQNNKEKKIIQLKNKKMMKIHPLKLQFEFELSQPKEINSSSNRNINLNSQTLLKASNKSLNSITTNATNTTTNIHNTKKSIRNNTRNNKIKNNLNNFNVISEERFTYSKKPFFKKSKNHFVNNGNPRYLNNNNIQTKNTFEYLINYKSELINDKLTSTKNQISGKKSYKSNNHKNKLICIKLTNDGNNKMQIKDFENSNYLERTNFY